MIVPSEGNPRQNSTKLNWGKGAPSHVVLPPLTRSPPAPLLLELIHGLLLFFHHNFGPGNILLYAEGALLPSVLLLLLTWLRAFVIPL